MPPLAATQRLRLLLREPVALLHLHQLVLRDRKPLLRTHGIEREAGRVLPAACFVVYGVRLLLRRRRARVKQLRLDERHAVGALEQPVEEGRAGRILRVAVELARLQLGERALEQRVTGRRGDEGVVDAAGLGQADHEVVPVEQRPDGSQALEVGVDVDAALAPEDLQAEDVGALRRRTQPLGGLGPAQVAREVGLSPELELPAWVELQPGALVLRVLLRQRLVAEPDLVEDVGDAHTRSGAGKAGTFAPCEPPSSLRLMQ